MLEAGMKAPDFALLDQEGNLRRLSDFFGRRMVLYFYSKNGTAGCNKQAQGFRDFFGEFEALGVEVVGISKDSAVSHKKFAQKHELPFTLLADTELAAAMAYDLWQQKKLYGKVHWGVVRTTFVIDEKGMIEKIFDKPKTATNAQDVLEYFRAMGK